jgi:hypothetical protein
VALLVACSHAWEIGMEVDRKVGNTETVQVVQAGGPGTFSDFLTSLKGSFSRAVAMWKAKLGGQAEGGSTLDITFKDCGDSSYKAKVTDVTPHTLTLGTMATITGTGTLSEDISDGTFDMKMTGVMGVTLLSCNGDASKSQSCDIKAPIIGKLGSVGFQGVTFPIKAGTLSGVPKVEINLPSKLPSVGESTTTTLNVATKSGDKVICVEIMTKPSAKAAPQPTLTSTGSCDSYSTQSKCDGDSSCTWCKCAAVPSKCYSKADAKKLPPGVFACDSLRTTTKAPDAGLFQQMRQRVRDMHPMFLCAFAGLCFTIALLAGIRYRRRRAALAAAYTLYNEGSQMQV